MTKDEQYQQRLVELKPLCLFLQAAVETLGRDRAREVATEAFDKYAFDRFVTFYNDIPRAERWQVFRDNVRKYAGLGFYTVEKDTDNMIKIHYHRCIFLEIFRDFGLEDFVPLYCDTDFTTCRKIDPDISMIRTMTLADGDPYCDHCWQYKSAR
ncbi:MAG: L-2-amino-thiazoline-4-carboxylic acid hydrolase [Candidatus Zixiibacteriota bacterium]|nr:MAG: L-2-amino-thiazoline-4-carboxylic acid hydrolase [candidate division Zixibacteria bacterium]